MGRTGVFPCMNSQINALIAQGVLKVAPVRPRSVADVARIRAGLAVKRP
jgi:hypothetical protein